MRSVIACAAFLVSLINICQAAVTLYAVEQWSTTSTVGSSQSTEGTTFPPSALGVNEAGATTYVMGYVNDLWAPGGVGEDGSVSYSVEAQTRFQTWVEDANGYTLSMEPSGMWNGVHEVCEFNPDDGTGRCVQEHVLSNSLIENTLETFTATYSGRLTGWYTLEGEATSGASGGPLPTETGKPESSNSEEDSDNAALGFKVSRGGRVAALSLLVGACVWLTL